MTTDGAFAICNERKLDRRSLELFDLKRSERTPTKIIGNYDLNTPEAISPGSVGSFAVSRGAVRIVDLDVDSPRIAMLVNADPNSNIGESRTVIPTPRHIIKKDDTV
jgi:hypothetical protein